MDKLLAGLFFVLVAVYFIQRNLSEMLVWVILVFVFAHFTCNVSATVSVILGLVAVYLLMMVSNHSWEGFENDEEKDESGSKKKKDDPKPANTPSDSDPHVDIGSTILHAYRNLTPEQIGGMRRDTKELMSLQKELMGSLSEMKPAIEQGAELLSTFSQFFGKQE